MATETKNRHLDVAIVRYPGSNCDFDTARFFKRAGHNPSFLWHKATQAPDADLLVPPGGFTYGDRSYEKATGSYTIEPGVQALNAPVMEVIYKWAQQGRPILGICNGFQILTLAGLLPGKLERNTSEKFFCDDVDLVVEGRSFFNDPRMLGNAYHINVAHGFGRYVIAPEEYETMKENGQVFLRYQGLNPNGSDHNIAGVCNKDGNIWGMMPHPERADSETRRVFMEAIENYVRS